MAKAKERAKRNGKTRSSKEGKTQGERKVALDPTPKEIDKAWLLERLQELMEKHEALMDRVEKLLDRMPSDVTHTKVRNRSSKYLKRLTVAVRREPQGEPETICQKTLFVEPGIEPFLVVPTVRCAPPVHDVFIVLGASNGPEEPPAEEAIQHYARANPEVELEIETILATDDFKNLEVCALPNP